MDGFEWTIVQIISLTRDIKQANDTSSTAIENMGGDHCGFDIFVSEEFLDGADVVAALQEVGGEGVAEGVTAVRLVRWAVQVACLSAFWSPLSWRW